MSEIDDTEDDEVPKRRRKAGSQRNRQIDIRSALDDPVRIKRDGAVTSIDPYEAMLRQHVRKSLTETNVTSMKLVLDEAEKHKLIKRPAPARVEGGVFVVPKDLPEDIQQKIFAVPDTSDGKPASFIPIMMLVYEAIGLKRLVRCFNGRKK